MTIFALEQAVSNGCQLDITEAESALEEVAALRAENERLRACFDWANGAAEKGWLPAQEVRKLRAQLAEAQKDAGRLDYIQKNARCDPQMDGNHVWWPTSLNKTLRGPTIRAAIDAAKGESNGSN